MCQCDWFPFVGCGFAVRTWKVRNGRCLQNGAKGLLSLKLRGGGSSFSPRAFLITQQVRHRGNSHRPCMTLLLSLPLNVCLSSDSIFIRDLRYKQAPDSSSTTMLAARACHTNLLKSVSLSDKWAYWWGHMGRHVMTTIWINKKVQSAVLVEPRSTASVLFYFHSSLIK